MKKVVVLLSIFAATSGIAGVAAASTVLPVEWEVIELINLERSSRSLSPVSFDSRLFEAARGHSEDMAQNNYFSHNSLDGGLFSTRLHEAGYPPAGLGEIIAAGYGDASSVVAGWMNSDGHRSIILGGSFLGIGAGYSSNASSSYKHYWTADFGTAPTVVPLPGAAWLFGCGLLGLVGLRKKIG
jgi:uncharacterized protein YkwD